jgi:hypothetical protein
MEYKLFYLAIRRYAKRKISRGDFIDAWEYAQSQQGIKMLKTWQPCLKRSKKHE